MSTDVEAADRGGMVPSQWFVRILAVAAVGLALAALIGSWNDIVRYVNIKRM